jgi:hypothetical protein
VSPSEWETKFRTHTVPLTKLQFYIFQSLDFLYETGYQRLFPWG